MVVDNGKLNRKLPILILSLVSIVCTVLSCITGFLYYDWHYVSGGNSYYELAFCFPSVISSLFMLLDLAPCILLFLYIVKFHSRHKTAVLYSIACGLIAVTPILYTIVYSNYGNNFEYLIRNLITDLAIVIPFVLLTVSALKGLSQKKYIIIATSIGLLLQGHSIYGFFAIIEFYVENNWLLYLFSQAMWIVRTITLYVLLLLFGLNNRIPALLSMSPEKIKQRVEKMAPEQSLRFLKNKFELGVITEEEYQAQRAEIITSLVDDTTCETDVPSEADEHTEPKHKFTKKKIIIFSVVLVAIIAIAFAFLYESEFDRVKAEAVQIAGRVSGSGDYFTIDTYPDEYKNMDKMLVATLLPNVQENALEAIKYVNKELGFDSGVYSLMMKTTALMGRQTEENDKYKVSWTYHPDDGLEVTYRKK